MTAAEAAPDSYAAPEADRSWSGSLGAALLATLEQPSHWAVSLVGFLARGGVLAFLLPIVVLPTPAAVQAELAPLVRPLLGGGIPPGLLALAGLGVGLLLAWIIGGGLVGAWADVVGTRRIATVLEPPEGVPPPRRGEVPGVLAARLVAHLPLAAALAWAAFRIFEGAYQELLTPFEVVTPLVVRIVAAVPDAVVLVAVTWVLGEAAGGLAMREIVLGGRGVGAAVVRGWVELLRRPAGSLATLLVTTLILAVAIVPGLVASATAWTRLRAVLFEGGRPADVALALGIFVGLWLGGLVLAAVATSARNAAWTAEWLRRRLAVPATTARAGTAALGTIGGAEETDRGGWPPPGGSGTL